MEEKKAMILDDLREALGRDLTRDEVRQLESRLAAGLST